MRIAVYMDLMRSLDRSFSRYLAELDDVLDDAGPQCAEGADLENRIAAGKCPCCSHGCTEPEQGGLGLCAAHLEEMRS